MANIQNFAVTAGEDQTLTMTARDQSATVIDLTSASISWKVMGKSGGTVLTKTGTVLSASAGTFTIALSDADTSALKDGNYAHEAIVTVSSTSTKAVSGRLRVSGQRALSTVSSLTIASDTANVFNTIADVQAASVASTVMWVFVSGYSTAADGRGGLYKRIATATNGDTVTTANGALFQRVYATTIVSSAPTTEGTHSSIDNSFTGDIRSIRYPVYHKITGTATAGQPTTGYDSIPEVMPFYIWLHNTSGWNQSTSSNDGRTGIAALRVRLENNGQGDLYGLWVTGNVSNQRSGYTSTLANPAVAIAGGDLTSSVDGAYLNPFEVVLTDNGYDVSAAGFVVRLDRTNSTAANKAFWYGYRVQNETDTTEYDVAFTAIGKAKFGLDLSFLTLDANKAAITLKADQRIYGNVTATDASGLSRYPSSVSTSYQSYSSALSAWVFVIGNNATLQIYNDQVGSNKPFNTSDSYKISSTQVVGARNTGWTAMTGSADKATAYDTTTVTLAQLAGRVMSLQAALTTHGLLGA